MVDRKTTVILKAKLDKKNYQKLMQINNPELYQFIGKYIGLCNPAKVFVCSDSPEDIQHIREDAIKSGEEKKLATNGHTVHFDGYYDQARDKEHTKLLFPQDIDSDPNLNAIDKRKGLDEIQTLLKNIMQNHKLYICFFCLGPVESEFSIPCVQLTDSSYVAHSEGLLYRRGYERFKKLDNSKHFFRFVHSEGELQNGASLTIEKRRIYIDTEENIVYSVNTQYGGNTIGLKKLAMRLAINKSSREGWLTEHMFIMGVHGPNNRVTYFTGAFPSACGKTSTSMIKGETIIGDDIAYLRKKMGKIRAVNPEKGIFGIIRDVNSKDDPVIWEVLNSSGEIIFSNVLVTKSGDVYWIGKDGEIPTSGFNYSGEWMLGSKNSEGNEITPSHGNARFILNMKLLKNLDSKANHPDGVIIGGIIYGGRDSDTSVPVEGSFDWVHGMITKGASLESETTTATLGKEGIRKFNPMANLDFLSIPLSRYIKNNLDFGKNIENPPHIFSVNYFLRDKEGNFLNSKSDKAVWLKWMELRSHKDIGAIKTPIGFIPKYQDLKKLFIEVLNKDYPEKDYVRQFTLKIPENLLKISRIIKIYETNVPNPPKIIFKILKEQKQRLKTAREKYGDYIPPTNWLMADSS